MTVGIWLTFLVSSNLTKPLQEITQVLRKVQNGLFETKVRVTSNDEIGYAGDVINAMTEGLIERDRIKQSLTLAKEIQQNLLPRDTLDFEDFNVAGKSIRGTDIQLSSSNCACTGRVFVVRTALARASNRMPPISSRYCLRSRSPLVSRAGKKRRRSHCRRGP